MDAADDGLYPRAPELEDLIGLARALNREGVRYLLIGGFAVVLHGLVRGTKDIDLLVDASPENVRALKRALATLPDNAAAELGDDELQLYPVVRVADEVVVDLMRQACGITYEEAFRGGSEVRTLEDVALPVATKELLIRTKQTIRESDAVDVSFLRMRLEEEKAAEGS